MRGLACVAGLLTMLAGGARAEEARTVPRPGTSLTYRMIITVKGNWAPVRFGEIYSTVITNSGGNTAEGSIKPLAGLYGCTAASTAKDCAFAKRATNAH